MADMVITSALIKQLRDKTGVGLMDCKRALEATEGNVDAAIEHLRKKGAAIGQKRADRVTKEGVIITRVGDNATTGALVEINCETDFVARSEDFLCFANAVAAAVQEKQPDNVNAVNALVTSTGKTVADLQNDLLARVGEKVEVRRFAIFQTNNGLISSYTHLGNKIGVLVDIGGLSVDDANLGVGRDVAMQIAAMNPLVISRDQIDKNLIEREVEIYRTQARNENRPAAIVDKIAAGRLEKFYQEVSLLEQTFIKDSGMTVNDYLREGGVRSGQAVSVNRFHRFYLGEETTK
ncbi:MAG: translation elongation factor Ts [Ignavibacteria bacterium]|nr:translation elongation factor Ts [Ignavibacteria bacterium]